jgi:fatty acid desaturase
LKTIVTHHHQFLSRRVFYRWLLPTLLEWVVIVALFWIGFAAHYWLVWVLVIIVLGSRQQALGLLGHDGAHFTAAKNKRLNDSASALLCFWPMLTTLADYREFHLRHHRLLNTNKDPEVIFKTQMSPKQWSIPVSRRRILGYFLIDLLGFSIPELWKARRLLRMCRTEDDTKRSVVLGEIWPFVMVVGVSAILFLTGYGFAVVIWCIALATSFWAFLRLRTWTEHVGTTSTHFVRMTWWQRVLIAPHASWSHSEHHTHPGIPFWARHKICEPNARTQSLWELLGTFGG